MSTGVPIHIAGTVARQRRPRVPVSSFLDDRGEIARDVVQHLPHGLIVTVVGGRVMAQNEAASELLGGQLAKGTRCCDVLGCGAPGTPLEGVCLTQLALRQRGPLPEIRVDLPNRAEAAWVVAAPMESGAQVVIHLRPAMRGDRRRRTEPHWMNGPRLRIRCLGPLRVDSETGSLNGEWTQQRAGQVLGYLLCERDRPARPEELAEALWPEGGAQVLNTVRYSVHTLRDRLEPQRPKRRPSTFVVFGAGGYTLNRTALRIDADEFEFEVKAGLNALKDDLKRAESHLDAAMTLYRAELLSDQPYAEWARPERDRLHVLASHGLRELVAIRAAAGADAEVWSLRVRLAELEPLDDAVHRDLILQEIRESRHSQAVRRYAALHERMERELGRPPKFSLSDLTDAAGAPPERA